MTADGFARFPTAIGECAVAWNRRGIAALRLPDADARHDWAARQFPTASETTPPDAVRRAVDAIARLLDGHPVDLSHVVVDLDDVPAFHRRVYEAARAIRPGETCSYGELAARIGSPGAARAVGQALGRNPVPVIVPCHRVLAADGRIGGFSAPGGAATKRRLLAIEQPRARGPRELFDDDDRNG
jgi:methylated-DNA-[protein]-cysteine S-methyltransferase